MNILLIGHGRMGQLIEQTIAANHEALRVVGIIDIHNTDELFTLDKVADVIIDFSSPAILPVLAEYVKRTGTALLSGTTGYTPAQIEQVQALGDYAPVLHSANYSIGIAVFSEVLAQVSQLLFDKGFDIEMTETHHNQKVDAPSGTAKLLLAAIDPEQTMRPVYGRHGIGDKRDRREIGIHALRGGTVAGDHSVHFYGQDETFTITHSATSRQIFVNGAIEAAKLVGVAAPGFYTLKSLLFEKGTH